MLASVLWSKAAAIKIGEIRKYSENASKVMQIEKI